MDLVEVIGKKNRKVPLLLPPIAKSAIQALVDTRDQAGIDPDNIYVFAKVAKNAYMLQFNLQSLLAHN